MTDLSSIPTEQLLNIYRKVQAVQPKTATGGGRLAPQEELQLKEARDLAQGMTQTADQANRFVELNRKSGTGLINKVPGMEAVRSIWDPNVAQMGAITARMAPAQRVAGSGTTSDKDLALFLKAIPNTDRPGAANQEIAADMTRTAKDRSDYARFLDDYAVKNGTLKGAQAAFAARPQKGGQTNVTRPPSPAKALSDADIKAALGL